MLQLKWHNFCLHFPHPPDIDLHRSLYLLIFSVSFVLTFETSGMAISISRQGFSFLTCSNISGQLASIVRSVINSTSHIIVVSLIFMTFPGVCSSYLSVTCNPIRIYRPVDVIRHHIVYISVFRWCKCCASCNNMFYVFFYLIAHSAFTIKCLLHDIPLIIMHVEWLISSCYY